MRTTASALSAVALIWAMVGCSSEQHVTAPAEEQGGGIVFGGQLAGGTVDDVTWARAVEVAQTASAEVFNDGCGFTATGSAVAVAPAEMLTNRHVVDQARSLAVTDTAGEQATVTSWAISTRDDLALLRLDRPLFDDPVTLASATPVPGDLAVVMGYPLGGPFTIGRGRVIDVRDDDGDRYAAPGTIIEASVDVLPGNSGGPLLDVDGHLIGLIRAIDLESGSALSVPVADVSRFLDGVSAREATACVGD